MKTPSGLRPQRFKFGLSGLITLTSFNLFTIALTFTPAMAKDRSPAIADPLTPGVTAVEHSQPLVIAQRTRNRRVIFRLSDRGVPVSRIGGAARGGCSTNTPLLTLTALTPITSTGKSALVETISPYPSFWVYVPQTSAKQAEFILQDGESQKELYQETMSVKEAGGITQLTLPPDKVAALEVNRQYRWSFTLLCDPEDPSANWFVEGVVQRVQPAANFVSQLETMPVAEKASLYAANGYWFESLDALGQRRQQNPQDPEALQDWVDLLEAVKLDAIANEPLLRKKT